MYELPTFNLGTTIGLTFLFAATGSSCLILVRNARGWFEGIIIWEEIVAFINWLKVRHILMEIHKLNCHIRAYYSHYDVRPTPPECDQLDELLARVNELYSGSPLFNFKGTPYVPVPGLFKEERDTFAKTRLYGFSLFVRWIPLCFNLNWNEKTLFEIEYSFSLINWIPLFFRHRSAKKRLSEIERKCRAVEVPSEERRAVKLAFETPIGEEEKLLHEQVTREFREKNPCPYMRYMEWYQIE